MCKEAVSGYRAAEAVAWRGRKSGSRGRDGGVDGGNWACETVGIRKQETAGRGGHSVTLSVLLKRKKKLPHVL